jgi:hypothetical protein
MRFAALIAGLAGLFLLSQKSGKHSIETDLSVTTNVCFEQSDFNLTREFESNETALTISFKQFSENSKKRTSQSVNHFTGYECKRALFDKYIHATGRSILNHFFLFNKTQSLLQVFRL